MAGVAVGAIGRHFLGKSDWYCYCGKTAAIERNSDANSLAKDLAQPEGSVSERSGSFHKSHKHKNPLHDAGKPVPRTFSDNL